MVASSVRLGVMPYFRSPPKSKSVSASTGTSPDASALPSAKGVMRRLLSAGVWTPPIDPASDKRYKLNCRGIGAQ